LFPNIFGGSQKQNSVVDIFKNAETITVHDPNVIRDYVHVDDIVDALLKAAEWPTGTYKLGSGLGTSTLALAEATGKTVVNTNTPRSKEPPESIVPNDTPNWIPTISVYEYLKA
jgi:nucleoside-diphosphate-sugar epimerase